MPILGVVDSAKSGNLGPATGYWSIASVVPGASTNAITISSIPSYFKSLQIRIFGMSGASGASLDTANITFNGDTGSNYSWSWAGSSSISGYQNGGTLNTSSIPAVFLPRNGYSTNPYGISIINITDYSKTTKKKTLLSQTGVAHGTTSSSEESIQRWYNGFWNSTSAISSITVTIAGGNFYKLNSYVALYGVV
jgi:hypothetical protein